MKIQSITLKNFAGLTDKEIHFQEGLNILQGPNEAGKSTIVDGIHASLFRPTDMKRGTVEYKDFTSKYMPYPGGDTIRTRLVVSDGTEEYQLDKEWSDRGRTELTRNGKVIQDKQTVADTMKILLQYGEATYTNIVFGRQKEFQTVLERLAKDAETSATLNEILRQAVMELDGVSLDALEANLEDIYKSISSRWDPERNRPEKNQGIRNKWKKEVGTLLQKFYEKEELQASIDDAVESEDQYTAAVSHLKEIRNKREQTEQNVRTLSGIEGDVLRRGVLEERTKTLKKDNDKLVEVNQRYPVLKQDLSRQEQEIAAIAPELASLQTELETAKKLERTQAVGEIISKVNDLEQSLQIEVEACREFELFTDAVLKEMTRAQQTVQNVQSQLAAGKLVGQYLKGQTQVTVSSGQGPKRTLQSGDKFAADGSLRIEISDEIEIQVASGLLDHERLMEELQQAENLLEEKYAVLGVTTLDLVKDKHEKGSGHKKTIDRIQSHVQVLLNGRSKEELEAVLAEVQGLTARPRDQLESLQREHEKKQNELIRSVDRIRQTLETWERECGPLDDILDILVGTRTEMKAVAAELEKLAGLPPEFTSVDDFKEELATGRTEAERLRKEEDDALEVYHQVKTNLPEISSEELIRQHQDAVAEFHKEQKRLESVTRVKEAFYAVKDSFSQDPYTPLIQKFGHHLQILTNGKYQAGGVDETLVIEIKKDDHTSLPVHILSMGTYDSAALAFRLAVLEQLFPEDSGLVILDDSLVNLDPARRTAAVNLIQDFARRYQVIFSTCNPDVATLLGGHVIQV